MISALQTKFQKHHRFVFIVLLAVIIVAFVFTIGAAPGLGGGQGKAARQDFFGYNLASERDVREIFRTGQISYQIEFGLDQVDQRHFENFALERIALLGLADELGIPGPTEEQFANFLRSRPAFRDDEGRFDHQRYEEVLEAFDPRDLPRRRGQEGPVTQLEFFSVMEEDFRVDKTRELVGGPGYVLPTEVRLQLEQNQTLWSIDLASFELADFEPEIDVNEEDLAEFFEENAFRYERSAQTLFSYALFRAEDFLDEVKQPDDEALRNYFERNRQRFAPQAEAEDDQEEPREVTLDEVRDEVEEALRLERARRLAGEAASDFAYALFEDDVHPGSEQFESLADRYGAEVKEAPPASPDDFPEELGFPRRAREEVSRLSEERHFSDPVQMDNSYIVLVYRDTEPAYLPPLEEVRDRVEQDYLVEEERRLLAERSEEIRDSIENRMAEGQSFEEAAEAEGLEVRSADEFSRASPPEQVHQGIIARLDEFEIGEVSPMIPLQNYGFFVHLREREVPEIDRTTEEFTRTAENLRRWSSMASENFLIQEIIERELGRNGAQPN